MTIEHLFRGASIRKPECKNRASKLSIQGTSRSTKASVIRMRSRTRCLKHTGEAVMHCRSFARIMSIVAAALIAPAALSFPSPLGNSLTYQGQLKQSGSPVNGGFDFECKLFDALNAGNQIGGTLTPPNIQVTNIQVTDGLFTLDLDFGIAAFDGNDRFLEIGVRPTGGGAFTTLSPRQKLNAAPYAQFAKSANIGGTIGNQVNLTNAANTFAGNGANLTGLNASNISGGTIGSALLSGSYSNALTFNNAANIFTGNGAGLTALSASNLTTGTVR